MTERVARALALLARDRRQTFFGISPASPRPVLSVRPIAPDRIVVLDSGVERTVPAAAPPKTIQWDLSQSIPPTQRDEPSVPSDPIAPEPDHRDALVMTHSLPQFRGEGRPWAEEAETMRLPAGATEDTLVAGEPAAGPVHARIVMTRLSRELGREYRERYGVTLTVDAAGIEAMQYHLLDLLAQGRFHQAGATAVDAELTRHGAFLSEILARRLGAEWIDLGDAHPTDWSMRIAPGGRVWPVWRVHNFLRQQWDGRGALTVLYERLRARAASESPAALL
jgi:hypothetical protein